MRKTLFALLLAGATPLAWASCGGMMCELNPAWDTQNFTHGRGLRLDLRYAYSRADVLRAGSDSIQPPPFTASGDEIENRRTVTRIFTADLDYAFDRTWGLGLQLPLVARDHAHTLDNTPPELEQADYLALGDVRVIGKYRGMAADRLSGGGLRFGLKLPTGDTRRLMAPGTLMEASLQPGTGSTDLILGADAWWSAAESPWGSLLQVQVQRPVAQREAYRPGTSFSLDLGLNHSFNDTFTGLLQLGYLYRGRDQGANAAPNGASGGYVVHLSPGLSMAVAPGTRVYGFMQWPLRQHVNGEQLTARWSAVVGIGMGF
ncbi:MAG TPA: hypothetical protein PLL19_12960 [Thiobacillaceae bacterium]|nr:hypothetical protein [Thiobacillaceae bacterium]HNA83868.1 hypothetical protein [Thiobacillaceae bacterium]HNF90237.1 hypothetical protein [Thiobacillaceae bacterium]HNH90537.1 hypothetical protein [Thiobacillaceae bacterium]HNI07933.1 hypothetical protein [Thiobacillaceae bacterium]